MVPSADQPDEIATLLREAVLKVTGNATATTTDRAPSESSSGSKTFEISQAAEGTSYSSSGAARTPTEMPYSVSAALGDLAQQDMAFPGATDEQLRTIAQVLEIERKRQEEIRKTKELELEILLLSDQMKGKGVPAMKPPLKHTIPSHSSGSAGQSHDGRPMGVSNLSRRAVSGMHSGSIQDLPAALPGTNHGLPYTSHLPLDAHTLYPPVSYTVTPPVHPFDGPTDRTCNQNPSLYDSRGWAGVSPQFPQRIPLLSNIHTPDRHDVPEHHLDTQQQQHHNYLPTPHGGRNEFTAMGGYNDFLNSSDSTLPHGWMRSTSGPVPPKPYAPSPLWSDPSHGSFPSAGLSSYAHHNQHHPDPSSINPSHSYHHSIYASGPSEPVGPFHHDQSNPAESSRFSNTLQVRSHRQQPSLPIKSSSHRSSAGGEYAHPSPAPTHVGGGGSTASASSSSTSSRKKLEEQTVCCTRCRLPVATFLLHPYGKNVEPMDYDVELICAACSDGETPGSSSSSSRPSRQPVSPETEPVSSPNLSRKRVHDDLNIECEVCKKKLATGGFKFVGVDDMQIVGAGGKLRGADGAVSLEAMNFRVEPICVSCKARYRLCTECGGGGKFRTGKYRPVELFAPNRRTCLLSHMRMGASPLHYKILTPAEISEKILAESGDVHMDGFYSVYALPEVIESPGLLDCFERVAEWAHVGWRGAQRLVTTDDEHRGLRKYLACVYIDYPQSKLKGTALRRFQMSQNDGSPMGTFCEEPTNPSGNLNYLFPQGAGGGSSSSEGVAHHHHHHPTPDFSPPAPPITTTPTPSQPWDPTATTPIQVAYFTAEWDMHSGTLLFANGYVRNMTVSTLPVIRGMCERLLQAAMADAAKLGMPEIEHLWIMTRRQHKRLQSFCQRLGFRPLDDYVRYHPEVDRKMFEREVHVPRELYGELVCNVKEYLGRHL
ncbi:uncharacterized protein EV422DRAFT_571954 [Fimicolochytrium jonesii]|uniref:uncharacterized protein n=1 Tax=Fimicolochytrium jonesii TaxID=1396493 RepID=UPI0022FE4B32|nr:uncharacterized protein EV422DRAFT_571954 [Fimicolochytrium jonesii]KAI8816211.1 hypothetical protein EV422DRAFT_571954 [Fimicolochytrium jonesii]